MNKPLVLVVEDDTSVRNLITTTLKTYEYRYLSAQNGASAVMEALSHNPDIVLLDLGLPDMDGVEIIRKIRSWSNMPIIVISARTEDSDKIEALDAGADAAVCTHVSNVFGYRLPVEGIAAACRKRGVPFVLDASQSAGMLPISLRDLGAAFIAMPGHKGLYGPQGTGLLLCGDGEAAPLLEGGTGTLHENNKKS